jgi:ribonuclease P protein component
VRYTLRKHEILRGRKLFSRVFSSGNKLAEQAVLCFYQIENSDTETNRVAVGFAVSKKIGKAVVRNRIKRLMRESYRLNKHILLDTPATNRFAASIVLMYGKNIPVQIKNVRLEIVKQEIEHLLHKLRAIILSKD